MKLSLVFPARDSDKQIRARAQDLISFWSKFPIEIEVLLVADPSADFSPTSLQEGLSEMSRTSRVQFKVLAQPRRLGRGAAVLRGLQESTGDVLGVNSLDLAVPLAEVFSGLQEFIMNRDQAFLLIGNRRGPKKKRKALKTGLRGFFEGVEHDKARALQTADPTSPFFMITKRDWDRLGVTKLRRWFYTPGLIQAARLQNLDVRELEIQSYDHPNSQFRLRDAWG